MIMTVVILLKNILGSPTTEKHFDLLRGRRKRNLWRVKIVAKTIESEPIVKHFSTSTFRFLLFFKLNLRRK